MWPFKFVKAHTFLDKAGVPRLDKYDNNVFLIEREDFTEQENAGNIDWKKDGVYLDVQGNEVRGFMYIKRPDILKFGKPKFHLLECQTIKSQRKNGRFHNHYFFSNTPTVTLTDRETGKEYKNETLELCTYCKRLIKKQTSEVIMNTNYFKNILVNNNSNQKQIKSLVDIYGRPFNWNEVSRAYKEQRNYTCEECGFGGGDLDNDFDKRYIHTHHINSNELTNTHSDNLKSLCILCHSKQDLHHKENFEKNRMKFELDSFLKKYKRRLIEIGNKYI